MLKKHLFFLTLTLINITSVYSMAPDESSDEKGSFTASRGNDIFCTERRLYKVEKNGGNFYLNPIKHNSSRLILKYNPGTEKKTKITNIETAEEFFLSPAPYRPEEQDRPVYLRSRGGRVWRFCSKGNKKLQLTLKTASGSDLSLQGRMSKGEQSGAYTDIYSGDVVQITTISNTTLKKRKKKH